MRLSLSLLFLEIALVCNTNAAETKNRDRPSPLCFASGFMKPQPECFPLDSKTNDRPFSDYFAQVYRSMPGRMIYQPTSPGCESCILPARHFTYAFAVAIREAQSPHRALTAEDAFDQNLTDEASSQIRSSFGPSATKALAGYSDTTPIGWVDQLNVVCRAHRGKPSLVLPPPYFEDVEYCLRLISDDGLPNRYRYFYHFPRAPIVFRLQAEIVVAVTKNSHSPYRQPLNEEELPFAEVMVKLIDLVKLSMSAEVEAKGWKVDNSYGDATIYIVGKK
ncbi:hypothetical protein [Bradyrhizobium sp. STM 3557]|uniref:hypothetical protein n=1 Tax=Bradyrhizobium sp. STM 3557 TaxID=578920 RepID=UPI00388F9C6F